MGFAHQPGALWGPTSPSGISARTQPHLPALQAPNHIPICRESRKLCSAALTHGATGRARTFAQTHRPRAGQRVVQPMRAPARPALHRRRLGDMLGTSRCLSPLPWVKAEHCLSMWGPCVPTLKARRGQTSHGAACVPGGRVRWAVGGESWGLPPQDGLPLLGSPGALPLPWAPQGTVVPASSSRSPGARAGGALCAA